MRTIHLIGCILTLLFLAVGKVGQAQDSLGMHYLSGLEYWAGAGGVQMVGDLVYVVGGYSRLYIMSLENPSQPTEIGRFDWSQPGGGIYVLGNLGYFGLDNGGYVLDLSNPAYPVVLGQWTSEIGGPISFAYGDFAIGEAGEGYPFVLDISNPTNVQYIGDFPGYAGPQEPVGMAGEYLCMTAFPGGLRLYDMTNPADPQCVASIDTTMMAHHADISGNYGYVATLYDGLRIIDLSNPLQPVEVAACDSIGRTYDVTVTDCYAVTMKYSDFDTWLNIWNVADPTHPALVVTIHPPVCASSIIASSGNYICTPMVDFNNTVMVLDISNPAEPEVVSSFGHSGYLIRMAINGETAYLADYYTELRTINIADPNHLSELGHLNPSLVAGFDIAIRENYAYVVERLDAGGTMGVVTFDVSNPAEPDSLGYVLYDGAYRIVIEGDYAYVARLYHIATFSLANPALPQCVNVLDLPLGDWGLGLAAMNGYLYYASGANFYVCSLSDPAAPELVGSCNLSGGGCVFDLAVAGNYAYVADGYSGMRIVDVSNPTNPTEINWIGGYWVGSVAAFENGVIMDDLSNIRIYDLTYPDDPRLLGYYATAEEITDMEIQGQYLFTASEREFRVYQCDAFTNVIESSEPLPTQFALLPPYPNPFNNLLTIPFTLPIQKEVIINIYNILGQKVQEFAFPSLSPGMHRILWDATTCASGVYIIRLISGEKEFNQKTVLLR